MGQHWASPCTPHLAMRSGVGQHETLLRKQGGTLHDPVWPNDRPGLRRDLAPSCMVEGMGVGPGPCHMHGGGQWGGTWSLPHAWWGTMGRDLVPATCMVGDSKPYVHTHLASGGTDRRKRVLRRLRSERQKQLGYLRRPVQSLQRLMQRRPYPCTFFISSWYAAPAPSFCPLCSQPHPAHKQATVLHFRLS